MTMTRNPGERAAQRRPRRSRALRRLVITVVVLVGLLVVADFGAAAIFEYQVSKRARAQFGLTDDPAVKVHGFSFLTQAVSGEYDHITVDAKGVPVKDTLRDVEVHADLLGVTAPLGDLLSGSASGVTVREVEGQVRVKASDVNRAISNNENELVKSFTNLTIDPVTEKEATTKPAEDAQEEPVETEEPEDTTAGVRMCGTADIAGQNTNICVFGVISLVEGRIAFSPKRLEVRNALTNGELPIDLQARALEPFAFTLDPGGLPFTVTPTAVKVDPGMLSVKGKASDVVLGGGG